LPPVPKALGTVSPDNDVILTIVRGNHTGEGYCCTGNIRNGTRIVIHFVGSKTSSTDYSQVVNGF